jgi:hypothetical protein
VLSPVLLQEPEDSAQRLLHSIPIRVHRDPYQPVRGNQAGPGAVDLPAFQLGSARIVADGIEEDHCGAPLAWPEVRRKIDVHVLAARRCG